MLFLPFAIAAFILYSSIHPAQANVPQIFVTTSLKNFEARIVERSSSGGGDNCNVSDDTSHPFAGRRFGERCDLIGTPIFGYPYGNDNRPAIAGRPFPYGLWPIYGGNNAMGSDEPTLDGIKPVVIAIIPLGPHIEAYNFTEAETYYILGDRDSALFIMISLVKLCYAKPAWPSKLAPNSANSTIKIENIIKYYRASSFALTFPGYSNRFATGNGETESTTSTPLPDLVVDSEFRQCIDDVIYTELTIMNTPSVPETPLSDKLIFGGFYIAIGTIMGVCTFCAWKRYKNKRVREGQ